METIWNEELTWKALNSTKIHSNISIVVTQRRFYLQTQRPESLEFNLRKIKEIILTISKCMKVKSNLKEWNRRLIAQNLSKETQHCTYFWQTGISIDDSRPRKEKHTKFIDLRPFGTINWPEKTPNRNTFILIKR